MDVRGKQNSNTSSHEIKATTTISEDALRLYLESKQSPLSDYSDQIIQSRFWSTIIGICTIEQYSCSRAPNTSPYNFWGIMRPGGGLARYSSYEEGIAAIDALLTRYEARGKDTIEELNGYYVVPASNNWFQTVLTTKQTVEQL